MFRDFLNNSILQPWRLDVKPHLEDLGQSSLFWGIVAVLVVGLLIYRYVRKR